MSDGTPTPPLPATPGHISLVSTSRASDAGFLALADLADIAAALRSDYRIVGGHMVTLLVARHGVANQVPLRETADADFAAMPTVIADPRLPATLIERGYLAEGAANRFTRGTQDPHGRLDLVIDILAPSFRGRWYRTSGTGTWWSTRSPAWCSLCTGPLNCSTSSSASPAARS